MKQYIFAMLTVVLYSTAYASELSDPFFIAITGKVCEQNGQCQRYNGESGNYQVELQKTADGLSGAITITYEIEGITVNNLIQVSKYKFHGKLQTEMYIELKNSMSDLSKIGISVLVDSLLQLNWMSPTGVTFQANGKKIIPELVIGPVVK